MICPACSVEMLIVEHEGVEIDRCLACRGIWFDQDEIHQLFRKSGNPDHAFRVARSLADLPSLGRSRRKCPRCRGRLAAVAFETGNGAVEIDRCSRGDGLWFDEGEFERVLGSSAADTSDPGMDAVRAHLKRFLEAGRKPAP